MIDNFLDCRTFSGWALSYGDWQSEKKKLEKSLEGKNFVAEEYMTAAFDSPFVTENRRNEVWLVKA